MASTIPLEATEKVTPNENVQANPVVVMIDQEIDQLVSRAHDALAAFQALNQEQVDAIVKAMALAGLSKRLELARLAVDETQKGVFEDKVIKNQFATEYIYHDIKNEKTVGIIAEDEKQGIMELAEPIGVIAGITPVTNPTSTTMFKAISAMKTRNPIVFAFHPQAQACSVAAAKTMYDAAIAAGAPADCIQWVEHPSVEATNALMKHSGIAMILATGGGGMVKAAYSSGKPALGVGPGNVPVYIEKSADIRMAVNDIIMSKTFDNGMICASEQAVVVDEEIADAVMKRFKEQGAYILSNAEVKKVQAIAIDEKRGGMSPAVVGQSAHKIAELAGITVPENTKLLIAPLKGVGPQTPLSREKLSPILGFYTAKTSEEAIDTCVELVRFGGLGHSAAIFSNNQYVIDRYGKKVLTSRILVNTPTSFGGIGDLYNRLAPSLTLGCGSYGGNSTSENVTVRNLVNIKRVSTRKDRMRWFKVPPKIYFEKGSLEYLRNLQGERAMIVADPTMVKLGFVKNVERYLEQAGLRIDIFDEIEPDPTTETLEKGVARMRHFQPDIIVAFGGGSAIDAAKGMWLFYEHPDVKFEDLAIRFADIRKRTVEFPHLGRKATMVAIPTTSGTGSEVTSFAVITDKETGVKYPLADYELTPNIAIIDPELTYTVPRSVTADTGLDVLSHTLEALVSVMASDYTDALALHATKLLFEYLPIAYNEPTNELAREKMHNASCMAGMAFTNAFLGVNHSLAHKLGGQFHIPHGRANAIVLPHVVRYNAGLPSKYAAFPQYKFPQAAEKYALVAKTLGLPASNPAEGVESLAKAIEELRIKLQIPATLQECGVTREDFEKHVDEVALNAFDDQCTGANPRYPLVTELREILVKSFGE